MRYWVITLVLALLPVFSFAADGNQAKFTMSFDVSAEMKAAMAESGGDTSGMASMVPEPITGEMWWTDEHIRMDMNLPEMMSEEDMSSITMLLDIPGMMMHMLNPTTMEAMEIDLKEMGEEAGSGMMGMDPKELTTDWSKSIEKMKAQPGTTVNELGKEAIDGTGCLHYSFEIDPSQMEESPMPGNDEGLAGMLGAFGGEVWVVEETGVPMKITTSIMGMDMTYKLIDMKSWSPTTGFFDVPDEYTLLNMEDMMEEHMPSEEAEG